MPPIESVTAFIDELQAHRLLSRDQLIAMNVTMLGRVKNARILGLELVERGWLTMFQYNLILKGQACDLTVGSYRILDCMGSGGSADVYKAWHINQERLVALKVVRKDLLSNREAVETFQREMWAISKLTHPNVVQTCEVSEPGENHFFAMEYLEGADLGKLVEQHGLPPIPKACDYIRQSALGLQCAHENCLIHRDIKPANLFLTMPGLPADQPPPPVWERSDTVIKVLDWGLADLRLPANSAQQPQKSQIRMQIIGTIDYCSPEQASDPATVDIRSDIYSLGCTLYFMLTGQPPFSGGSLMQKIIRHREETPKPIEQLRPEVPPGLATTVRRMLEKDPAKRFRNPAAVAATLGTFCTGIRAGSPGSKSDPTLAPIRPGS